MKLTRNEFAAICGEYLITPEMALENEQVVGAIKQNDRDALKEALETEF